MDMSIVLEEEKPVSVNEVPDYHEDIHTYLREMEVKALRTTFYVIYPVWWDGIEGVCELFYLPVQYSNAVLGFLIYSYFASVG